MCALLGPNGAGKSTLLGIVSTLVRPTGGQVRYRRPEGGDISEVELRSQIGLLAHSSLVYSELSADENLRFYGRLYNVGDLDARISSLLDEVGLEPRARQRPARTYSRGMLQRLSLARALLSDPPILLLDEPFTGLDRGGASALAAALAKAKARGRVLLIITHDFESIGGMTDHVAVLKRGRLVFDEYGDDAGGGFSISDLKDIYHQHTD